MEHRFGFGVLAALQVGVEQKFVRVELIHGAALLSRLCRMRSLHRADIGIYVLLPHSQASKYMAGHVDGMGRRGCNFAIVLGGGEPVRRERRRIAGMNDVVHHSRMIGIFHEQGTEHRHGHLI